MLVRGVGLVGSVTALALACTACTPRPETGPIQASSRAKAAPSVAVAAAVVESPAPVPAPEPASIEFATSWRGFGVPSCSYLAPANASDFIGEDGGIDVVFHFHAGQMSEREMKASGVRGVFVSCGYGIGTGGYSSAFADPKRFGWMMKRLTSTVGVSAKRRDTHLRRLALVSWSAGFAAIQRILSVPEWYEAADAVVLLDSLHARYVDPPASEASRRATFAAASARGAEHVDVRQLRQFTRFATDALAGRKTMVITHSSIIPPDYASTTEATAALLREVGVIPVAAVGTEKTARGMALSSHADEGGLHVRGFRGVGPRDHFDHLHMIDEALRSWLVPRWYTPVGERP